MEAAAEVVPLEGNGIEVRIDKRRVALLSHLDTEPFTALVEWAIDRQGCATARARSQTGWIGVVMALAS
jgi:hypothetical protein